VKRLVYLAAATSLALLPVSALAQHYKQVNLVANSAGVAPVTDPNLINPWGISRQSGSPWWISDNGAGVSTLYTGSGDIVPLVVTIPKAEANSKTFPAGTPTGAIANGSMTDFLLSPGNPALFLFASIDGAITGWNPAVGIAAGGTPPSTQAVVKFRATDGTSYTGLTAAKIKGKTFLYAANFGKGRVDVFDNAFHKVNLVVDNNNGNNGNGNNNNGNGNGDNNGNNNGNGDGNNNGNGNNNGSSNGPGNGDNNHDKNDNDRAFVDNDLPRNYVPFNVQAIGNDIVVTFVLHQEGHPFETDGAGLGFVDIFSSGGKLIQRLEHGDWLNAPWGVALAPLDFGTFSHALLIGQFAGGETTHAGGTIAAYDLVTGEFLGQVKSTGSKNLSIAGLWSISPGNGASPGSYDATAAPAATLYFTAGPNHGADGLFGYLEPAAAELTQGNNQ
jgi:hypothetical protein